MMQQPTYWKDDLGMLKARWIVLVILLLVGVGIATMGTAAYYIDKSTCHGYAIETGRQTKFQKYNLVMWDCLTPSADGNWIPIDQLRALK